MTWILYVIKCNAKVIKLNVGYKRLPPCMFNSETLEELSLFIFLKDKALGSRAINLPRLKKLKLYVDSYDSDILNKLALGCPELEVLTLHAYHINIRVVSFPKLKYLKVNSWGKDTWVESIRTPNLVSLVLVGFAKHFKETSLEKMPSLMNATISLWRCYCFDVEKCNLLRDVANVRNLELTGSTIQALIEKGLPRCPTLFNLTTLSLRYFCMICHSNECKNLDEIEVELERINVRTKQVVNALVESLAELKTTHLILSVRYNRPRLERRNLDLRWADGNSTSHKHDKDREVPVQVVLRCSRSHVVFSINIHMKEKWGDEELFKYGRLSLVDLAGSDS
ncbi:FBD-associated F-box protein [Carex littledalei]|uniref:FBD-associated F-box protein n=1 Tax=Carex littledalei TaxID=544730 RepID=A0A833RPC9_9POAL|nr:FBD-associated F-box protein [Carex littledalei]